ncbi:MAG: translation elongation factor 4, partial [Candidatus Cloacimonadales bacterium]
MKNQELIRNFCIIAHIDHGKSTLADRLLEVTNVLEVSARAEQILDDMDLERERGITIKSHAIRMEYKFEGKNYVLNLIDTPGHVDFSYEVSRSLASCDGALLLVDAAQGIEAQTMSNLYLAMENELEVIPVINKIDLPKADIEGTVHDIEENIGVMDEQIFRISAKMGTGVEELLQGIIKHVPAPKGDLQAATQALIFDSYYDKYRGVIILVRVVQGSLRKGQEIRLMSNDKKFNIEEIGYLGIKHIPQKKLDTGEVGYIIANIKDVADARVGDTVTTSENSCEKALPGFQKVKPMVYSGIFPLNGDEYENLRDAMEKLRLNDAALVFEPEGSLALGFGFRCGFLGMLHLEIVKERLMREFNVPIITTTPSVTFKIFRNDGEQKVIYNPVDFPDPVHIDYIEEPFMDVEIIVPAEFIGNVMKIVQERRG